MKIYNTACDKLWQTIFKKWKNRSKRIPYCLNRLQKLAEIAMNWFDHFLSKGERKILMVSTRLWEIFSPGIFLRFYFNLQSRTSSCGSCALNSSIFASVSWTIPSAWLTASTRSFLILSSFAYCSAFFTMFSISSLLRPPLDWITTVTKLSQILELNSFEIRIKLS